MYVATDPPRFGYGQRMAGPGNNRTAKQMSAKAFAACSFEPVAEQTVATGWKASDGLAAEIQFREDLWREYRLEAINAGFSTAQATEYASALSPDMGLIIGLTERAPVGRGWFYQSRAGLVGRTIGSGLITLRRWKRSRTIGRITPTRGSIFSLGRRPWNAGDKS